MVTPVSSYYITGAHGKTVFLRALPLKKAIDIVIVFREASAVMLGCEFVHLLDAKVVLLTLAFVGAIYAPSAIVNGVVGGLPDVSA